MKCDDNCFVVINIRILDLADWLELKHQSWRRQVAVVVAVVSKVAVDIDDPSLAQATLGSDRMAAIVSDGMAAMDSTMVTMRGSK